MCVWYIDVSINFVWFRVISHIGICYFEHLDISTKKGFSASSLHWQGSHIYGGLLSSCDTSELLVHSNKIRKEGSIAKVELVIFDSSSKVHTLLRGCGRVASVARCGDFRPIAIDVARPLVVV